MFPEDVGALVSAIGLWTQTGGAFLLAGLFTALRRSHPRPQPYFREWTRAWYWLLAALLGVVLQYGSLLPAGDTLAVRGANLLYQGGKLVFVAHLVAGTLNYVRGVRPRDFLRRAIPLILVYATVTAFLPGVLLNGVMLLQAPLIAGPFILCAWLLLRLPQSRSTMGSRATGTFFGLIAVLWLAYAFAFARDGIPALREPAGSLDFLLQYNSYLDLLLQILLGFGMVVLLLEDAKREADDARAQLALAHDRLKRVSLYDPLTGALNRRAYDEGVGLEAVGARFGTAVMLDMDNLKAVNDAFGHAAGDDLLRRVVEAVRGSIRPTDRVYRWGGDEFLVLFPGALAEDMLPRIRAAFQEANEGADASRELLVSLGAADYAGAEEIADAIERADRAMYDEKARNRRGARPAVRIA
ncbi:GGDEF domain-containing protein [Longimicrobium sp.]|uniref:GGDEF domain-containing protein n=1 Tax=Longimicrobium sp. TaxID=2029185 RepID=UPI002E32358F|nr:GGDEF domain-containing protein [Longimicrobium sp.]HEX6040382.1 GGDEF domain-containing protein [Longimicrobium sp.]